MIKSSDPAIMIVDEMIGSMLITPHDERDNADVPRMEYAALVRALGYVVGGGVAYGTEAWRTLCLDIRAALFGATFGHSYPVDVDTRYKIHTDAMDKINDLRARWRGTRV